VKNLVGARKNSIFSANKNIINMRKIIAILAIATFAACSNGTATSTANDSTATTVDSAKTTTDSAATTVADTTKVVAKAEATTK